MDFIIREMQAQEYPLLRRFLHQAIYLPEGIEPPPLSVVDCPALRVYIENFGDSEQDRALAAQADGAVVGAIWARIMSDYGHLDNTTPSLALSVCPAYRGAGIGTALLEGMMAALRKAGCKRVSLSVQKVNPAVRLYRRVGFETVAETAEEYIMAAAL